jgi:hypothetical protein
MVLPGKEGLEIGAMSVVVSRKDTIEQRAAPRPPTLYEAQRPATQPSQ